MTNLEKLDIEIAQAKIQIEALFKDWNARQEANIKALHEVSDKLIERLDNIQSNLNVNIQGSRKKDFLTLDEVKAQGLHYYVYTKDGSVYEYRIKGKGYTLVENGIKLCENVYEFCWYSKGVYQYKETRDSGWTLKENDVILCENVYLCKWYAKGVYEYEIGQDKGYTLKENGKILLENVFRCHWHSNGVYKYKETAYSDYVQIGF